MLDPKPITQNRRTAAADTKRCPSDPEDPSTTEPYKIRTLPALYDDDSLRPIKHLMY